MRLTLSFCHGRVNITFSNVLELFIVIISMYLYDCATFSLCDKFINIYNNLYKNLYNSLMSHVRQLFFLFVSNN